MSDDWNADERFEHKFLSVCLSIVIIKGWYRVFIQIVFFSQKIVSIFCWAAIGRKNVAPAKSIGCTLFNFVYNFAELLQQ